jgi:UrcA family protein
MKTVIIAALLGASLAPLPVHGQPAAARAVRYADLDLATPQGRAALDLRLFHAASALCGAPSPADPNGLADQAACIASARASASAQRDAVLASIARRGGTMAVAGR